MKRLLQINPVLRVSTSTGRIMQEIGELAIRNGWESYVAYSKGRDGEKPCNSITVPVGSRGSVVWHGIATRLADRHGLASSCATRKFIREIERIRPDIVHIHNIHGYFLNYRILFEYLSRSGIQVVWTVHDCWLYTGHCYYYSKAGCDRWKTGCGHCPQQHLFPASLLADRSAQNFRDKRQAFCSMPHDRMTIVPVSDWIRSEMEHSFLSGYRFRTIHNGIDTSVFTVYTKDTELLQSYGITAKHIILGVAGIWSDEKGFGDLMELSGKLGKDEVLVMVGLDSRQMKSLPSNVIGIHRTENIGQLARLYSAADVFVNPTWQDNYPTVNLEAIACGTPVVTYRTGGSIESVTEDTGFIVDQGDIDAMFECIRTIENLGQEYWSGRCRQYALQHFRKEDRYADYIRLYERLLDENRQ